MSATEEWGLPDWQDATAYPGPDDLTAREWWWEFNRRRPDYRQLWAESDKRDWSHDTVLAADVDWLRIHFHMSRLQDPRKSYSAWTLMQNWYPNNGVFEPWEHERPEWRDDIVDHLRESYELKRYQDKLSDEAHLVMYRFNLDEPLEPQLQKAATHLRANQRELYGDRPTPRHRRENWPIFLRCLDGRDCGATYQQLADILWPGLEKTPQSARDTYKAACQLRDSLRI
jgi:hypothetical protein